MPIASFEEENKLIQETVVPEQGLLQGMSGFLVKKGLASNQTSADLTLLVLAGFCICIGVFFYFRSGGTALTGPELERNIQQMKDATARIMPARGTSSGGSGTQFVPTSPNQPVPTNPNAF